jgi:hypothetical protein
MFSDPFKDTPKLHWLEAVTFRDGYFRLQPNLCVTATALDVDVRNFSRLALIGKEEVSQPAFAENDRHSIPPERAL